MAATTQNGKHELANKIIVDPIFFIKLRNAWWPTTVVGNIGQLPWWETLANYRGGKHWPTTVV